MSTADNTQQGFYPTASDNVTSAAAAAETQEDEKVWIQGYGWRKLPEDAVSGEGELWAWSSARNWFKFRTEEELSESG